MTDEGRDSGNLARIEFGVTEEGRRYVKGTDADGEDRIIGGTGTGTEEAIGGPIDETFDEEPFAVRGVASGAYVLHDAENNDVMAIAGASNGVFTSGNRRDLSAIAAEAITGKENDGGNSLLREARDQFEAERGEMVESMWEKVGTDIDRRYENKIPEDFWEQVQEAAEATVDEGKPVSTALSVKIDDRRIARVPIQAVAENLLVTDSGGMVDEDELADQYPELAQKTTVLRPGDAWVATPEERRVERGGAETEDRIVDQQTAKLADGEEGANEFDRLAEAAGDIDPETVETLRGAFDDIDDLRERVDEINSIPGVADGKREAIETGLEELDDEAEEAGTENDR